MLKSTDISERYLRRSGDLVVSSKPKGCRRDTYLLPQRPPMRPEKIATPQLGRPLSDDVTYLKQAAMLVNDVVAVNAPKKMIPSLVWLETPQKGERATSESPLYFSSIVEAFKRLPIGAYREIDLRSFAVAKPRRKLQRHAKSNVIERRAQVVDRIPGLAVDSKQDDINEVIHEIFAGFALFIDGESIRIETMPASERIYSITDMYVGPLYLDRSVKQGVMSVFV